MTGRSVPFGAGEDRRGLDQCVERLSIVNQLRIERPNSLGQPHGLRSARCRGGVLRPSTQGCDRLYLTVCHRFSCIYTKFDGSNRSRQRIDRARPFTRHLFARDHERCASPLAIRPHVVGAVDRCRRTELTGRCGRRRDRRSYRFLSDPPNPSRRVRLLGIPPRERGRRVRRRRSRCLR